MKSVLGKPVKQDKAGDFCMNQKNYEEFLKERDIDAEVFGKLKQAGADAMAAGYEEATPVMEETKEPVTIHMGKGPGSMHMTFVPKEDRPTGEDGETETVFASGTWGMDFPTPNTPEVRKARSKAAKIIKAAFE